jgi:TonB family protein
MDTPAAATAAGPVISPSGWLGGPSMFAGKDDRKMGRALFGSLIVHGVLLVLVLLAMQYRGAADEQTKPPDKIDVVYLQDPGPGGGGGGSPQPAPPKKLEITPPKPQPVVTPSVEPQPVPVPTLNAPVTTMADMLQATGDTGLNALLGGGGTGRGLGSGKGDGVGPGEGGGQGGGVFRPGSGIKNPSLLREVKPTYTPEAIRAKLQGIVELEVTVLPDGSVDPTTIVITKSLDRQFGLDEQAKEAAKNWKFVPGTSNVTGQRVPVRVGIEMTFTLR